MTRQTLAKEDWIAAGFRTLARDGPKAVQINVLAKDLSATKGSFYWHFKDMAAFKAEMLTFWIEKVATEIIEEVRAEPDPKQRLNTLAQVASRPAPEQFGGRSIEPAMRAWALSDPEVATVLARIDATRIAFLATLLKEAGHDDPNLPALVYGAYIGLDDLAAKGHASIEDALNLLIRLFGTPQS